MPAHWVFSNRSFFPSKFFFWSFKSAHWHQALNYCFTSQTARQKRWDVKTREKEKNRRKLGKVLTHRQKGLLRKPVYKQEPQGRLRSFWPPAVLLQPAHSREAHGLMPRMLLTPAPARGLVMMPLSAHTGSSTAPNGATSFLLESVLGCFQPLRQEGLPLAYFIQLPSIEQAVLQGDRPPCGPVGKKYTAGKENIRRKTNMDVCMYVGMLCMLCM